MLASPARLDLRSLATLRVALALTLLADLSIRWGDAAAHYGPHAIGMCRSLAGLARHLRPDFFPCDEGSFPWTAVHFAAHAAAGLCLLLGWRTRIATAAAWALLVSLHNRNGLILNGGDTLLRAFLFWAMFLPLGERWSVDARRIPAGAARDSVHSAATWIFLLQMIVVYPVAMWHRQVEPAWWDGTALAHIFANDQYSTGLALRLQDFPSLLTVATYLSVALESAGWLVALVPVFGRGAMRTGLVLAFVAFHLGIAATMGVGMFPMVSAAGWLALLPAQLWDRLVPSSRLNDTTPRIRSMPEFVRWQAGQAVLACLAVVVLLWNIGRAGYEEVTKALPPHAIKTARLLRMEQNWRMFRRVPRDDGWFVLDAELADGRHVDLLHAAEPLTLAKPSDVLGRLPNRRWGKLLANLQERKHVERRAEFVRFYTALHNEAAACEQQVVRARLLFVDEASGEPQVLWHQMRASSVAAGCTVAGNAGASRGRIVREARR